MPIGPRIPQGRDQVVSLDGWEADEDFPFGPLGAKAKRIFICPNPPPFGFLIGGHRYIFKEPQGARSQQVWSEVIAYEIGKLTGIEIPPAFLATGPGNGSPGVLIEYFYGHRDDPDWRLAHGIERLQARGLDTDMKRGSLLDNLRVCRVQGVPNAGAWWADTVVFDALIGNTDRHSENWGFLVERGPGGAPHSRMAPAFDNGTSLGFIIGEDQLADYTAPAQLAKFIAHGHHHFGWTSGEKASAQHIELCRILAQNLPPTRPIMRARLDIADREIDILLRRLAEIRFPTEFTIRRATFVGAQLKSRRDGLLDVLGA